MQVSPLDTAALIDQTAEQAASDANRWLAVANEQQQVGRAAEAKAVLEAAAQRFPTEAAVHRDLARAAEAARDWPTAEQSWRAFAAIHPALWWGHTGLANALREQGRLADAESVLTHQLDAFPDEPAVHAAHARIAELRRDWPAAETRWARVAARFPAMPEGTLGHARALRESGRPDEASDLLATAVEQFPAEPMVHHDLARAAEARRDWAAAEQNWRRFIGIDPRPWWGPVNLAHVLREQGQIQQAADVLAEARERFPDEPGIAIEQARLAERLADWPHAAELWSDAATRFPDRWEAQAGLARAWREQGQVDEARKVLALALEHFPAEFVLLHDYARLAEAANDWPEAETTWRRFVTLGSAQPWGRTGLAHALRRQGRSAEARAVLTEAAARFPADRGVLHDLARLKEAEKDWAGATDLWCRLLDVDPDTPWVHTNLATALEQRSCFNESAAILGAARLRFPDSPAVMLALARFTERARDEQAAIACWTDARRSFPDDADVLRGLIAMLLRAARVSQAEHLLVLGQTLFPAVPWFIMEDARLAERRHDWADAEAIWRRAVEQYPEERECHFGLAGALRETGKLRAAAEVLANAPGARDSHWNAQQAQLARARGNFGAAAEYWRQCVAAEPDNEHFHAHAADCLAQAGQYHEADEILAAGVARLGRRRGLLFGMGAVAEKRRDWDAAIALYRTCAEQVPDDSDATVRLAFALARGGRRDEGDEILRAAMVRRPNDLSLAVAFARMMPMSRAPAHDPQFVARAQDVAARFPDAPEGRRLLADALLHAHRLEEAEAVFPPPEPAARPEIEGPRPKISAFVITYNRANVLGTCLRSARFADELIVVDKSSTDGTRAVAESIADEIVTVPWTPTVEETRTYALSLCKHEWILFLDDDECLSAETEACILKELGNPRADVYLLPQRHYILGRHDERAYYWPEHQIRLFRRGTVTFTGTVHGGLRLHSNRMERLRVSDGVSIHNLSHQDTHVWIEKTNRYTSRPDRAGAKAGPEGFAAFAHERIDHWMARSADPAPDGYAAAVALLRAVYDMVDAVKAWETETGLDGEALFAQACQALDAAKQQGGLGPAQRTVVAEMKRRQAFGGGSD